MKILNLLGVALMLVALTATAAEKSPSGTAKRKLYPAGSYVNDGKIYACARPGDDCSDKPIGVLQPGELPEDPNRVDEISPGKFLIWGKIYACSRPGDDCTDKPLRPATPQEIRISKETYYRPLPGDWAEKLPEPPNSKTLKQGFVVSHWLPKGAAEIDGNIYRCSRPGHDCSSKPIGFIRKRDKTPVIFSHTIPGSAGIIGGKIFECDRPGVDCNSDVIGFESLKEATKVLSGPNPGEVARAFYGDTPARFSKALDEFLSEGESPRSPGTKANSAR